MRARDKFPEAEGRRIVEERSGGACEACRSPFGTDWAHRKGRAQGGTWEPSNGLFLCRTCHSWCHANPALARERGLIVKGSREPKEVPVRLLTHLGIRWGLLDNTGCITWQIPGVGLTDTNHHT